MAETDVQEEDSEMKKIPTIFDRDWNSDRSRVVDIPHPDCAWVFAGEGTATIKLDGTCCMVRDGALYKRREIKKADLIARAPAGFEVADTDELTGKVIGWVPVGDGPEDQYHREAFDGVGLDDGTYELVGPKIQGNPEKSDSHVLWNHNDPVLIVPGDVPRTFDMLRAWLRSRDIEGLVFHHHDGRMAKIKLRDFGLKRGGE